MKEFEPVRVKISATFLLMLMSLILNFFFIIVPLLYGVVVSFYKTVAGRPFEEVFTLANYGEVIKAYGWALGKTMQMCALLTVITLVIAFPAAYFMAVKIKSERVKTLLLFMLLIPFWVDWSARTMAWYPILGERGFINMLISWISNFLGLTFQPIKLIFTSYAILIAWIQLYVLFMIVPIYLSFLKMDPILISAAETLGANKLQVFYHIIFKMALPGIAIGSIYVFSMSMADYATPAIVGGGFLTLGAVIAMLMAYLNWPLAIATSIVQLAAIFVVLLLILRVIDIKKVLY